MFSLVFVSIKLNGEHGKHLFRLPWGRNPLGRWLFPGIIKQPPGDFLASRAICLGPPNSSPPKQRRVRGISSWTHSWFHLDPEQTGMTRLLVPSPGAFAHLVCGLPRTHWENQTASRSISQSLIGLIQTKPQQAFAFLSFITFILI